MSKAFETGNVGGIEVKNRIFRSATFEGMAVDGGRVSPAMKERYQNLSEGEVGLIITGYVGFSKLDNLSAGTVLAESDEAIPGLTELADIAHGGGSRIVAQINHAGSQLMGYEPTQDVLSPSDVADPFSGIQPKPLSGEQISDLVKEFAEAALRLKKSGFDGVQIHGAHGYLLSKFLSPVYNKRTDEYGGSPVKNVQIILKIIDAIKAMCGDDFPVWIKLNCSDFGREDNAYDFDSFIICAKEIIKAGIDAIELSGGTVTGKYASSRPKSHEAYHLDYAKKLAAEVNIPIVLVGGFRNINTLESALSEKNIEAVSMSRPLVREPGLVKRWLAGDNEKSTCVACNGCYNPKGTQCFFELEGEERETQKFIMKMMNSIPRD